MLPASTDVHADRQAARIEALLADLSHAPHWHAHSISARQRGGRRGRGGRMRVGKTSVPIFRHTRRPTWWRSGEAAGYQGMRWSGIAFTVSATWPTGGSVSARLVRSSATAREPSGTIVDLVLGELDAEHRVIVWNTCRRIPAEPAQPLSKTRRPTMDESRPGQSTPERLLELIKPRVIVAVGRVAEQVLGSRATYVAARRRRHHSICRGNGSILTNLGNNGAWHRYSRVAVIRAHSSWCSNVSRPAATSCSRSRARPSRYLVVGDVGRAWRCTARALARRCRSPRELTGTEMRSTAAPAKPAVVELAGHCLGVGEAGEVDRGDRRKVLVEVERLEVVEVEADDRQPRPGTGPRASCVIADRPIGDQVQHQVHVRRVEPPILERQRLDRRLAPAHSLTTGSGSRLVEHLRRRIDRPHSRAKLLGRVHGKPPGATADVQQPPRRAQCGERAVRELPPLLATGTQSVIVAGERVEVRVSHLRGSSCGSPRSGSGRSIVSKSRGTTVLGNSARASSRMSRGRYRVERWVSASIVDLGVATDARRLERRGMSGLAGALDLGLEEGRLVDQKVSGGCRLDHARARTRVAGEHDPPTSASRAEHLIGGHLPPRSWTAPDPRAATLRTRAPRERRARGPSRGRTAPVARPRPARTRGSGRSWEVRNASIRKPVVPDPVGGFELDHLAGRTGRAPITGCSVCINAVRPAGPYSRRGASRPRRANVLSMPGRPRKWSAWQCVIRISSTSTRPAPDRSSCRWVPSPQSISSDTPLRRTRNAGSPR